MINNHAAMLWAVLGAACSASQEPPEGFQGVVELDETVLAFETGGRVESLPVDEGDLVRADTEIARLDDRLVRVSRATRVLEAEAARAESDLVRAGAKREDLAALRARVRAAQATESLLEKNAARERTLFDNNAVSRASVDQIEAELARARAERQSIEAELSSLERGARREERAGASARAEAAEAVLGLEDERLERHVLRAGREGRVLDVHVEPGEVVSIGTPIVTIGDTRHPYVEIFVPQGELAGIAVGLPAKLSVDAERAAFSGTVEHVARRVEFTPRFLFSPRERPNLVVRVRVRIDDSQEKLHAGVPAFVRVDGAAKGARP